MITTKKYLRREHGLTLVEILAAVAIAMVMLMAIYAAVNMAQRSSSGLERKISAQQDARTALELMAMEIRMASYNRNATNSGIWLNPSDCSVAATATYRGIQEATPNSITIEMDINDSDAIGDASSEIIRYEYLSANSDLRITRETIQCASGVRTSSGALPFLGASTASATPRGVLVVNNSLNIPLLRYFDQAGTEIFPTTGNQTMIPNIRRIDISLAVDTEDIDPATKQRRRLVYSTSVTPINHGLIISASP